MDKTAALYRSPPTLRSLGHAYVIYADRIELELGLLMLKRTWIIAKDDIVSVGTYAPPVVRTALWALKLDWADLYPHVGLRRKSGFFKQLRFTPQDPEAFAAKARQVFDLPLQ